MASDARERDNTSDFAIVSGREYIEARRRNTTTVTRPLIDNSGRVSGSALRNDLTRIRTTTAPDTSPTAVAARMEAVRLAKERRAQEEEEEARQRMVEEHEEREIDEYEACLADEQYRPLASSVYIPLVTALGDTLADTHGVFGHVEQSPASPESVADDGTRSQGRSVRRSQQNPNHDREVWARHNSVRPLSNISALSNDSDMSSATLVNSRSAATLINSASDNSIMQANYITAREAYTRNPTLVNSASDNSIMRADYIPLCEADAEADKADENDEEVVSEEE